VGPETEVGKGSKAVPYTSQGIVDVRTSCAYVEITICKLQGLNVLGLMAGYQMLKHPEG
jgi:hypothetical protein